MSRTYQAFHQALKKAAEESDAGREAPSGHRLVDEHEVADLHWDMVGFERVEYQKIRVWLTNAASRGEELQTVMVVSCRASTGSTTTAALLAATLAEGKNLRVLIIDGNFRTPSLNRVFNVTGGGGFSEVVSEGTLGEARIQLTNRPNLSVLTTGRVSLWPTEVFEGGAIDEVIAQLKRKFNFIIFDSAPVLEFPDAYALAPKVDGVILVVGAEQTPIRDAQIAKRNLERAGGRFIGVVLNRERDYTPRRLRRFFGTRS